MESEVYSEEDREWALYVLDECGGNCGAASRITGISSSCIAVWRDWRKEGRAFGKKKPVYLPYEEKRALVSRLASGEDAGRLAEEAGVCKCTISNWRRRLFEEGDLAIMTEGEIRGRAEQPGEPEGDIEELRRRVRELELRNAILEGTIDIIKKDPGADASSLTNREKATLARALRNKFWLSELLGELELARSTYYEQVRAMDRPDKYAALRERVRELFEAKGRAWGSERIWALLRNPEDGGAPVFVSEKVVRRVMAEEGLVVVYRKKARPYCSYRGEISEHPGDKVGRRFRADAPNVLWLTDITQFNLPSFKCYLSPVIDCFDGKVVAHRMSLSPNAELANSMLRDACATLRDGEHPIEHSDCGCHYRWPGWIGICEEFGLERSMSAKGCSPDNSACEGFFGRMKN
ncbi:MAG: IS3 family transposase, partial [Eggerthellaceae bacterium]|nr:IS3 family transposase [Eggerthellaceae bacterium]